MKRISIMRERGSVLVLTAVAIFPAMFLMAFAIDISHWFDYSRNLQNRADAAALAAAGSFGNVCFANGGTPGTTSNGAQATVGKWAQLYSGAGLRPSAGAVTANLPYTDAQIAASTTAAVDTGTGPGTGWDVTTNGYINNTLPASSLVSPLTLTAGSLSDFWLVLNGKDYAENGGTSFSMLPGGTGATFCNSDPKEDLTDPDRASAGPAGPMLDVKVSQRGLPLFFQGLFPGLHPNIHAHARVQLQGESSAPSIPIAVSDTGFTPCVTVYFKSTTDDSILATAVLTKKSTSPIIWDNSASPASVTIPAGANVYVQPFLNDCNGSGEIFDDSKNTGVLYVNGHPASDPTVSLGDPPKLTQNGVVLLQGTCSPDTYFSLGGCTPEVDAYAKFEQSIDKNNNTAIFAVDHTWDNVNNQWVTGSPIKLSQDNGDRTHWTGNLGVPDQSGIHQIEITWSQSDGSVGTTQCGDGNGSHPPPCTGSFGVQQQSFGACNGCDQPDDSGPIILAQLRKSTDGTGVWGANSLARGAPQSLVVTLQLAGLFAAKAGDPATILRFPTSGSHQTGLIDCGQGNATSGDADVVYYGCGPANPKFTPPLNPLFVNTRNTCGTPAGPPWPSGNHQDCVQTTPGTRRVGIICPLVNRITGAPENNVCNNNSAGVCPVNHWPNLDGTPDPRAIGMIITSAADLAGGAGSPQSWIPIRRFATFYITGWDQNIKPQCGDNEPFPGKGKTSQNAAVWGHWTNYVDFGGIGDNQNCPINSVQPVNCVPVLTR
jgi:hypothetical protein